MSGGANQNFGGGGMGGGPQSGGPQMITGGPYQGPPKYSHGAMYPDGSPVERPGMGGGPIGQPTFGVGMPGGGWGGVNIGGGGQVGPGGGGGNIGIGGGGNMHAPSVPGGWNNPMFGNIGGGGGWGGSQALPQFLKAKAFADRGKMGRARQAIMQGGGQWSPQLQGLLSSPSGQWGNVGWNTMA